jgi:hypothetical protein
VLFAHPYEKDEQKCSQWVLGLIDIKLEVVKFLAFQAIGFLIFVYKKCCHIMKLEL